MTAWARTMFSSIPHLQAAHCRISSVVPTKLPSTRGKVLWLLVPRRLLFSRFPARTSGAGFTRAAHQSPLGSDAPTPKVEK